MIRKLLYKWFGLTDDPCESCEILRERLLQSDAERQELLHRLLDKDKSEPPQKEEEDIVPIRPQFTPWRVRQQLLEQEDRQKAKLTKEKAAELAELERELGVSKTESAPSGGVKFNAGS